MKKLSVFVVVFVMALVGVANVSAGIVDPAQVTYTTSVEPYWFTPDNNHNLSNGIVSPDPFDADWCGYGVENLEINFNLNGTVALSAVDISYMVWDAWNQMAPSSVELTFSTDGVNFADSVVWSTFDNSNFLHTTTIGVPDVICQYVKVVLTAPVAPDNGYYHRLGEVTFNEVPEPATMLLLGVASLALIRRKK